jgi:hypothetical protein
MFPVGFAKPVVIVFFIFAFAVANMAQAQDKPLPDRWHGLILDQSTVDDALKALGKTSSDKTIGPKDKAFRVVTFKKVAGMNEAKLMFRDDKLVSIGLQPAKRIEARALPNIYGIEFDVQVSGIEEAVNPKDYERSQGKVYPKTYPAMYFLNAVTERSTIRCVIANNSLGSIIGQTAGVRDNNGFPGRVSLIQLNSRVLDNRDGADVLK